MMGTLAFYSIQGIPEKMEHQDFLLNFTELQNKNLTN